MEKFFKLKENGTTVSREMVAIPGGGYVVDMPGVRGLGLWDADAGIGAAFADIEQAAQQCRFRDCKHENEPGCAVRAAVESGEIAPERFASYQALKQETATLRDRREEARRMRGEKASDKKPGPWQAPPLAPATSMASPSDCRAVSRSLAKHVTI